MKNNLLKLGRLRQIKSEQTRQLLLQVCDNVFDLWPLLEQINLMVRVDDACRWLIKNKLIGRELYHFWKVEKRTSPLAVLSFINQGLEKNLEVRPLYSGRDIV